MSRQTDDPKNDNPKPSAFEWQPSLEAHPLFAMPQFWMQSYMRSIEWTLDFWTSMTRMSFGAGTASFGSTVCRPMGGKAAGGGKKSFQPDPYEAAMRTLSADMEDAVEKTTQAATALRKQVAKDVAMTPDVVQDEVPGDAAASKPVSEAAASSDRRATAKPAASAGTAPVSSRKPTGKKPSDAAAAGKTTPGAAHDSAKNVSDSEKTIDDKSKSDDLERIKGIGPKVAAKLKEAGYSTIEQIAKMDAEERETLDQLLEFRGRIERENWVQQAASLHAADQSGLSGADS